MTDALFNADPAILSYLRAKSVREPDYLKRLRDETAQHPAGRMQILPEQGSLLRMLVLMMKPKLVMEIGVFTGYSAAVIAAALPEDGKLIACDHDIRHAEIQNRYWTEAGIRNKIDLRADLACNVIPQLMEEGLSGQLDMIFIDADKGSYITYFEQGMTLLRAGGMLIFDNVLWSGRVADPDNQENLTVALRKFNDFVAAQLDYDIAMLPIGDGMTMIMKPDADFKPISQL